MYVRTKKKDFEIIINNSDFPKTKDWPSVTFLLVKNLKENSRIFQTNPYFPNRASKI